MTKKYRKQLKNSTVDWSLNYPKDKDLAWKVKKPEDDTYIHTKILPFHITKNVSFQKNKFRNKQQMSLFDFQS